MQICAKNNNKTMIMDSRLHDIYQDLLKNTAKKLVKTH
jgi:hypothetical protein